MLLPWSARGSYRPEERSPINGDKIALVISGPASAEADPFRSALNGVSTGLLTFLLAPPD